MAGTLNRTPWQRKRGAPVRQIETDVMESADRQPHDWHGNDVASALNTLQTEAEGLNAVRQALHGPLGTRLSAAVALICASPGRVVVTGIGKSGHVARKIAATLSSTGTPALYIHPAEASHGDLGMIQPDDVVLALSWSGETAELSDIVAYTRRFGVSLLAITAHAESALGTAADIALVLPRVTEACPNGLAPTTSTTAQMALGDALAICLLSRQGFSPDDFRDYHPGGKLGTRLRRVRDLMHRDGAMPLVTLDSTLSHAILVMTSGGFGLTGVVDGDGRLAGIVTDGDLRRAFEGSFTDRPVHDIMGRHPRTIRPDALAEEALAQMNLNRITALFVTEDNRPVGVIRVHDLLRAGVV